MPVDPALVAKDMYGAHVGEFDERVVRAGWTYYVQAVKRPGDLLGSPDTSGSLLVDLLVLAPAYALRDRLARGRPWTVGIVRLGYVGSWNDDTPRVVHQETVASPDPSACIAALVELVREGRFHPGGSESRDCPPR